MNGFAQTLALMKKAGKFARLAQRKNARNGHVTIDIKDRKPYAVAPTDEGHELAERHEKAQDAILASCAGKTRSANGFVASCHRAAEEAHDRDLPKTGTKMD